MSYGGNNLPTPNNKRSTSCSQDYSLSKLPSATEATNNSSSTGSRFYSKLFDFTSSSILQGSRCPPSCRQYRGHPFTRTSGGVKVESSRLKLREPILREIPFRSTYRPADLGDHQESQFGSLSKPSGNIEDGNLRLSGLSLSSLKNIKKSTSQQDISAPGASHLIDLSCNQGFLVGDDCARPLQDLPRRSGQAFGAGSSMHSSRLCSFIKGKISPLADDFPVMCRTICGTVARLNRRNEAERSRTYGRGVSTVHQSLSNLPNNNANNFSQKYMNKGCTGLQNIGNTCFMNCVVQCLANTQPLLELCLSSELLREKNVENSRLRGSLVSCYVDLVQSMWKGLDLVTPSLFKYEVSKFARLFAGYNQHDAQEFLMYLLQGLHEELNRAKDKKSGVSVLSEDRASISEMAWRRHLENDDSYIVDLFEGLLKSALTCKLCGYVSNTFDPLLGLSLPIKKVPLNRETTLVECLELFTQEEVLDENEKSTCGKCHRKQNSTKRLTIQRFPKILIINLKRFSEQNLFRSKLSTLVRFPIKNLDLHEFSDETVGDRAVYNLYGICNHSGNLFGGHYVAVTKNPYSGEWHTFDDHRVSRVSEKNLITSEAYILFYELSSK